MTSEPLNRMLAMPPKRSLGDEVVSRLRDAILNGSIAPGERLREENLAGMLQVSRGPIREALIRLEREGLVLISPNKGASVVRLSREDLDEVYSLRTALERLAVIEAIKHPDTKCFPEMQHCIDRMAVALLQSENAARDTASQDTLFHKALVQSAQHKRLYRHWMDLRPQIHWLLLQRAITSADFREYAVSSHQAILSSLQAREEARTLALLEDHMRGSYERVLRNYAQLAPEP